MSCHLVPVRAGLEDQAKEELTVNAKAAKKASKDGKSDLEYALDHALDDLRRASDGMLGAWDELKAADLGHDKNQVVKQSMNESARHLSIVMNLVKQVRANLDPDEKTANVAIQDMVQ